MLLGVSLPFVRNLAGAGSSVNVAFSDLLLAFLFAGIVAVAAATGRFPALVALRPVRVALGAYTVGLAAITAIHFGGHELVQMAQRLELFLVPTLVGAYAVLARRHVQLLTAYVLAVSVFALVWPVHSFGVQKNPAGQFITNAILLLIAYRPLRRFSPALLALVPGLLLTQSRGAIVALLVGLAVVGVAHPSRGWALLSRIAPLAIAIAAAFTMLSPSVQDRLTTLRSGDSTQAQYSIRVRHAYSHDAKRIVGDHPVVGVGIGNYQAGDPTLGTATTDPHDVVLLQAAEGGYPLMVAFIVLISSVTLFLYRSREVALSPAAAAVMLGTVAHGLVDVYWVHGTPVLSWLLVGMVCALLLQRRAAAEAT